MFPVVNWQITATTINCDAVKDEVTIIVYKDGLAKCTGFNKYGNPDNKEAVKLARSGLECLGPLCDYVESYRKKLFKEEEGLDKANK